MAKKGKPASKSGGEKAGATKSKATPSKKKAPAQPTVYVCPYTHQNVYIGKATLKDLKAKSTYANTSRKRLWTLPSPQVRNDLYVEAAQAIAEVEQTLLPSFGGRSWEVTCKLTEPHWSGQVLFRAWKGQMELAVLPHLIDKIPTPPVWPGRRAKPDEYEEDEDEKGLQQREVSTLSSAAWDWRESYPVPSVTLKFVSPERKIFNSRKAAWEHATNMAAREVEINKSLLGVGASGKLLKPFVPSAQTALKVGKLRFERDGLWVVGQELAWQGQRPEELVEEEAAEEERRKSIVPKSGLALYLMRKREEYRQMHEECTTLKQAETVLRKIWKTLPCAEQKEWNRQVRGDEEESEEESEEEEEPMETDEKVVEPEPEPEPEPIKPTMTTSAFYVKSRRLDYQQERKAQNRSMKLSECDIWLREEWKALARNVKEEWKQKHLEYETKKAEEKAQAAREEAEREAKKRETEAQAQTLEEAKLEAEKRGAEAQAQAEAPGSPVTDLSVVPLDPNPDVDQVENTDDTQPLQENSVAKLDGKPVMEAGTEPLLGATPLHLAADDSTSKQKHSTDDQSSNESSSEEEKKTEKSPKCGPASTIESKAQSIEDTNPASINDSKDSTNTTTDDMPKNLESESSTVVQTKAELAPDTNEASNKCWSDAKLEEEKKEEESPPKASESLSSKDAPTAVALPCVSTSSEQHLKSNDQSKPTHVLSSMEPIKKNLKSAPRKPSSKKRVPTKQATARWCMNQKQIELCFEACMEHYDTVMRTVKARDLHRELQDGFDVFRERGHGRYDMELPAFENPKAFGFLNDTKKAPWMPVVKAILGDDAILIHKGCFLSMPGAAPQEYHQDGVHLTTQTQRPCHAINVFVPLIDLNSRNGPTEFCLGSHVLGLDGYDRDFVEIPKPKAGSPVIFDYRLGHRGLGNNSSRSYRPVVYCTYARASQGKEFKDSVNFSRKRYHKIGDLSAKPMSREERRNKRKRGVVEKEEEEVQLAMTESAEKTTSTTESKEESTDDSKEPKEEKEAGGENDTESSIEGDGLDSETVELHQDAIAMALQNVSTPANTQD
jgi:hypothetical protein